MNLVLLLVVVIVLFGLGGGYYGYRGGYYGGGGFGGIWRGDTVTIEAPAEVWVRANEYDNGCQATWGPAPEAVRYVRGDEAPLTPDAVNAELNRAWKVLGQLARCEDPVIAAAATLAQQLFDRELDALLAKSTSLRRVAR